MIQALSQREFTALLKKGSLSNFLFFGEEAYTKFHALKKLRGAVLADENDTFNHIKIDARDEGVIDIDSAIEALPVFAERKLIELHGFDIAHMKADEYKAFLSHFEMLSDNPQTVLVLVTTPYELDAGSAKKPSKTLTELAGFLTPVNFAHESRAALEKWVIAHFTTEHISAHPTHAAKLIDRVGTDMFALSGEIDKLCAYLRSKGENTLTLDDINEITCANVFIDTFDLSNAISSRNREKAFFIIEDMRKKGEAPEKILSQIASVFCDLAKVRSQYQSGADYRTCAVKLKMNEYKAKLLYSALGSFPGDRIDRGVELCAQADMKIKCTALDKYTVLSRLVLEAL